MQDSDDESDSTETQFWDKIMGLGWENDIWLAPASGPHCNGPEVALWTCASANYIKIQEYV